MKTFFPWHPRAQTARSALSGLRIVALWLGFLGLVPFLTAQPFNAADYGTVSLHLKADELALSNNAPVQTWGPLTAPAVGNAPTFISSDARFKNQPVVKFDGNSDYLTQTSVNRKAQTIFAVVALETGAGNLAGLISNGSDGLNIRRADASYYRTPATSADTGDFVGTALPLGRFYVNNIENGSYTGGVTHLVTAIAGSQKNYINFWIGSASASLGRFWNGSIAEVLIYENALTAEQVNRVGYYLQEKYNLPTSFTPPPARFDFTATVPGPVRSRGAVNSVSGAPVQLAWNISGATSISINQGILSPTSTLTGSATVSPTVTTTYTLSVTEASGVSTQALTVYVGQTQVTPRLNEFLASNSGGLRDEDKESSDWIEIYNPNRFAISLAGYKLKDGSSEWVFPTGSQVEGWGYLVVFASSKNRTEPTANLHTNFGLSAGGEYLALLKPDNSVATEFSPAFPEQFNNVSYGFTGTGNAFFPVPSPGAQNGGSVPGVVKDVQFSVSRGFFSAPFSLTLTTPTAGATIRYTLDSSTPSLTNGSNYTAPLTVSNLSTIRAKAFYTTYQPSYVTTQSYIFISDVLNQTYAAGVAPTGWPAPNTNSGAGQVLRYGWNSTLKAQYTDQQLIDGLNQIPSVSIVTDQANLTNASTGIYVKASEKGDEWERPASFEYIPTDGSATYGVNAGLKIRGGASRGDAYPKHSLRLNFRSEYGASSMKFPIHGPSGTDEFETLDLRTEQNYHWANSSGSDNTAVREVFARDLMAALGQPTTRSRYLHLYLNGQYWGIYQTEERAQEDYGATYFGGHKDDYDVIQTSNHPDFTYELANGTIDAWQSLWNMARTHQVSPTAANYFKILGKNPDGQRNSSYPVLLDVDNLITYMLLHYYTGDGDGPLSSFLSLNRANNWRGLRNRNTDEGFRFFVHDAEHTLLASNWVLNRANTQAPIRSNRGEFTYSNPEWIHEDLSSNPEYKIRFADFAQKFLLNNGPLTSAKAQVLFDARAAQISQAIIPDVARWGTSTSNHKLSNWTSRLTSIRTGFFGTSENSSNRGNVLLGQLRVASPSRGFALFPSVDAPTFAQFGGAVSPGYLLTATVPVSQTGSIYYTVDGTDPRAIGGAISGSLYAAPGIPINGLITVKARFLSNSGEWSALTEAEFSSLSVAAAGQLAVSRLLYKPTAANASETTSGYTAASDFEYIELQNIGAQTLDIRGVVISGGIDFSFAGSPVRTLAAGAKVIVAGNAAAFSSRYGSSLPVAGTFSGALSNSGELIRITGDASVVIREFTFAAVAPWPTTPSTAGYALDLISPASNPDHNIGSNWKASDVPGGYPAQTGLTIANWRQQNFSSGDLTDPTKEASVWGDLADPDGDGVVNLMEFATGSFPNQSGSAFKPAASIWTDPSTSQKYLMLTCRVREGTTGLTITAEASINLQTWPDAVPMIGTPVSQGDGTALATFRDTVPMAGGKRFARIRVAQP